MKFIALATLAFTWIFSTSIYSLEFQDIDGNSRPMSQYQGKKILIVPISTGSSRVGQLQGLQQLHQQYGDSLVVIGFPTNSFNSETRTDAQIRQFCQETYGVTFLLAKKNPVTGEGIQSIFHWLASSSENGVMDAPAVTSFQKFLVNESGQLVGVFSPSIAPTDPQIVNALTNQ